MSWGSRASLSALKVGLGPAAWRFHAGLAHPERAQARRLRRVLRLVAGSQQASAIAGLAKVSSAREFQDAVPIRSPSDYAPWIEAAKRGDRNVLTNESLLRFEKSGGSSGVAKFIPYTRGLLDDFHSALAPWLVDLLSKRPRIKRGPSYWSLSPMGGAVERTAGGTAVGAPDDGAYFARALRPLLATIFAVPSSLTRLCDVATCRYVTLRLLLARADLAFISIWNPSFLTLLLDVLDGEADRLIDDLARGTCRPPVQDDATRAVLATLPFSANRARADHLRRLVASGPVMGSALWPHLALISVWMDAHAAHLIPLLRARFPEVELQGKGLLATEGVTSIPLLDAPAPALAIRSHFLEFLDPQRPDARPRLAHEIEDHRTYEVLLTTSGGLLRYRIGDLVHTDGRYRATPCVRFAGRADRVSDLVGEKLSAVWVADILERLRDLGQPRFLMLAPEWTDPPAYHLFAEADVPDTTLSAWATDTETALFEGHHYRYARELGQLGPVRAVRITDGSRRYERRCLALGQRAGDIKPEVLRCDPGWLQYLAGSP